MNKPALLAQIIATLDAELQMLTRAALATHNEATDEENKAEDKYDTRGLEASYLAHGQSKAAEEAALAVAQFQALPSRDFRPGEPVSLGALVVLTGGKAASRYFVGPRAGGTEVDFEGDRIMVITPQSPLGRQLLGKAQGERMQLDLGGKRSEYVLSLVA